MQYLLGKVQSEIDYITEEINFYSTPNSKLDQYERDLEAESHNQALYINTAAREHVYSELDCSGEYMGLPTKRSCATLQMSTHNLTTALYNGADSIANAGDYNWARENKLKYIEELNKTLSELESQKTALYSSMGSVNPLIGSIAYSDPKVVESIITSKKDDQWLQFEFNSEDMESSKTTTSSRMLLKSSFSAGIPWLIGASGRSTKDVKKKVYDETMSNAELKVKGKLLRVHIKRPWFKPEIFDDRNLEFVSCFVQQCFVFWFHYSIMCMYSLQVSNTGTITTLGAPGRYLTEKEFINAMLAGDKPGDVVYRLPEYVTSFLLAKDIDFEISNTHKSFFDTFMESTADASASGKALFFFKASVSEFSNTKDARTRLYKTANGMKIKIPGAQMIGYYTQKLPMFPINQKS